MIRSYLIRSVDNSGVQARSTMRILHVAKKYPKAIGGDAHVVHSLASCQRDVGHDVWVLTTNCREIVEDKYVIKCGISDRAQNYDRITLKRIVSLVILFFSAFRVFSGIKPDIIHSHSPDMGFFVSIPARLFHIPIIQTCHGVSFNDPGFPLLKRHMELFFLKYGGFACITTVDKLSLPDFVAQGIGNAVYIPNGVDQTFFSLAKESGITAVSKFLFVGRLEHQKGLDVLVDAVIQLVKMKSGFSVAIIGEGSLKEEISRLISIHSLEHVVHLAGTVGHDELIRQYASADAFLLPSRWEGLPLTLLEAWAAELAVVVSRVGGIPALCEDMVNAVVIEPEDSHSLCRAMRFLMDNPAVAEKMGHEGHRVATSYSWDSVSRKYEDIYRKIGRG